MARKSQTNTFVESNSYEIDCAVCLQACVHPTVLPCNHIFCFLCVKGLMRTSRMCAMCRSEVPADFVENPSLLHPLQRPCDAESGDEHRWFYEGRNGGWWQYECRISEEIENVFKMGEKTVELVICGELYVIDLNTNHQYQKNNPIRRRNIKRARASEMESKGIAGLKT